MNENDEFRPRLRGLVLLAGVRGACSGLVSTGIRWLIEQFTNAH